MSEERSQRILVIDDDTTQRILVKEYLEEAGYSVRLSDDGSRGLKMASKFKPDLIILDWMLPSLDGYTLCTCLKQQEATADIPIILITASRDRDVIERGLSAGADDFVTKPVDWVFLADRVANVLEKTRQQAAITRQLQNFKQTGEDSARQLAVQFEQAQRDFDSRIQAIEAEAIQEIQAAQSAARTELAAAEQKYAAAVAELQAALDSKHAELAEHRRRSADSDAELAALKDEHARQLQAVEEEAQNRLAGAGEIEKDFAQKLSALEAEAVAKLSAAEAASKAEIAALKTELDGKLKACWNLAYAASNHHRELAFQIMDAAQGPATGGSPQKMAELSRSLADSIGSLNLLSQMMAGKAELKENSLDLCKLVTDAALRFKPVCDKARISIKSRVPQHGVTVAADEARLTYALASLVINATRFTPQGGEIVLAVDEAGDGSVSVIVSDTGVGMPAGQLNGLRGCLDQPWTALAPDGKKIGYGIPIATALARQHGGALEIESSHGQGTLAAIVIPAERRAGAPGSSNRSLFRNAS